MKTEDFLLQLCDGIYKAEAKAQEERKRELFGIVGNNGTGKSLQSVPFFKSDSISTGTILS